MDLECFRSPKGLVCRPFWGAAGIIEAWRNTAKTGAVAFLRILGILHWRIQNRIPLKVLLTDGDEAAALGALWARLEFSSVLVLAAQCLWVTYSV